MSGFTFIPPGSSGEIELPENVVVTDEDGQIDPSVLPPISARRTGISSSITDTDDVVIATASGVTLTLHSAASALVKRYTLQNASNDNISFATTSSQTVNGSTTGVIIPNQSLDVVPSNGNWIIT